MKSLIGRVVADISGSFYRNVARRASSATRAMRTALVESLGHLYGSVTGKYYWEDYVRVYPDPQDPLEVRNFLNHRKFYAFAAQFAHGAKVADLGCGSGYGSVLLKEAGAASICASDASTHAIEFAKQQFGGLARFEVQGVTDLRAYPDRHFDLAISSEVLEHIKEYGKENEALAEMKRVTKPGGIIVIGTPNSELLGDHGFYFDEMDALMKKHFTRYCIFENALVPPGDARDLWEKRVAAGKVGVVVTQPINIDETVVYPGEWLVKRGDEPGTYRVGEVDVDTTLLHNTHSWAIVAIRDAG